MNLKKVSKLFLISALICGSVGIYSGCNRVHNTVEKTEQEEIYDLYVQYMNAKGEKPLTYKEWLASIKGEKGENGTTPHIGTNGNWWIGERDTGVAAKGDKGNSILSIEKTSSEGNVDTYTITFSDGSKTTFNVTNSKQEEPFNLEKAQKQIVNIYGYFSAYGQTDIAKGFVFKEDNQNIYIASLANEVYHSEKYHENSLKVDIDSKRFDATIMMVDRNVDVAILKVSKLDLIEKNAAYNIIENNNEEIYIGEKIYLVTDKEKYVDIGFVTGVDDFSFGTTFVEYDEEYNLINKGHFVFNDKSEIIGINGNNYRINTLLNIANYLFENKSFYPVKDIDVKAEKISFSQIVDKMNNDEEFVVFIGSVHCTWCVKYADVINAYLKENTNKKIYYLNINNLNYFEESNYDSLMNLLKSIPNRNDFEYGLSTPTTIYVKDGVFADGFSGAYGIYGGEDYVNVCNFMEGKYIGKDLFEINDGYYIEDTNQYYNEALNKVVNESVSNISNIETAVDLMIENFENQVKEYAKTNSMTEEQAKAHLLQEVGYSTVEEMREKTLYELKLSKLMGEYYGSDEIIGDYYDKYIEERLPYVISTICVESNKDTITYSKANNLYEIIKGLESGEMFSNLASNYSDMKASSTLFMDTSYSDLFIKEFFYGTLIFDSYMNKNSDGSYTYSLNAEKLSKLVGGNISADVLSYYSNGFNFIDMSIVNLLGEKYNEGNTNTIYKYNKKVIDGVTTYEKTSSSIWGEKTIARNIIFNNAFNNPGISVIGYSSLEEIPSGVTNYVKLKIGAEEKYIITDNEGKPVFIVKGSSNSMNDMVYISKIDFSSINDIEEARKYFSLDVDKNDQYETYIEYSTSTIKESNELKETIKQHILANIKNTIYTDKENDILLQYEMFNYYLKNNNIELEESLKELSQLYINSRINTQKDKFFNEKKNSLDSYELILKNSASDEVLRDKIPYECIGNSYSNEICRYIENEGFEIKLDLFTYYFYENNPTIQTPLINEYTDIELWTKIGGKTILPKIEVFNLANYPYNDIDIVYTSSGWYKDKEATNLVDIDEQGNYYVEIKQTSINTNRTFVANMEIPRVIIAFLLKNDDAEKINTNNYLHLYEKINTDKTGLFHGMDINIVLNEATKNNETFIGWKLNDEDITSINNDLLNNAFNNKVEIEEDVYQYGDIYFYVIGEEIVVSISLTAVFE